MLKAHPRTLQNLLDQYEELVARDAQEDSAETHRRLDDTIYTLCVSTGTRDIESALAATYQQLSTPQQEA